MKGRKVFKWIALAMCAAMIGMIWAIAGVRIGILAFDALCFFASFAEITHTEECEDCMDAVQELMGDLMKIDGDKKEDAE